MLLPCLSIFSLMFSLYSVYIQCEDFAKLTVFGFVPVDVSVSLISYRCGRLVLIWAEDVNRSFRRDGGASRF